jgi:RHS repeat-associated protein
VTVLDGNGTPRTVNESLYGNPWTFTGRRLDGETGLMYFRNRMYETGLGRFVGRDPIGYVGGILLYGAYFVPNGTDPLGLDPPDVPIRRPPTWMPGLSFGGIEGKTKEEFEKKWVEAEAKRVAEKMQEASKELAGRNARTFADCSDEEKKAFDEAIQNLQDMLRKMDCKKCPKPCCVVDCKQLADDLDKIHVRCKKGLKGIDDTPAGGMVEGHHAFKMMVDPVANLTRTDIAKQNVVLHETFHLGKYHYEDEPYPGQPSAANMAACLFKCAKDQGVRAGR